MGSRVEEGERHAFFLRAFRQLGQILVDVHNHREKGNEVSPNLHEIVGETPINDVPVQIILDKHEIDPPSPRLESIKTSVRANNRRIIVTAAGTGVVIATIGTIIAVKHLIDRDPKSDITDR